MWGVCLQGRTTKPAALWVGSQQLSPIFGVTHLWLHSHYSDVLSLANNATLVGEVASVLLQFIAYWVQTPSSYDALFAKAMPDGWATIHQPVLSQHGHEATRFTTYEGPPPPPLLLPHPKDDHILYTNYSLGQPMGMLSPCYRGCASGITIKQMDNTVRLTCQMCSEVWRVPLYRTKPTTTLGRKELVAVPYPQQIHPTLRAPPPQPTKSARGKPTGGKHSKGKSTRGRSTKPTGTPSIKAPTNDSLYPPVAEVMSRSSSLPIASTSAEPSSETPTIRIRPVKSYLTLPIEQPSPLERSRSITATPPPPSPQEQPMIRKRAPVESMRQVPTKKSRP